MSTVLCPDHQQLSAYLVGRLSDEAAESIAAHLDSCPACQAQMDRLSDAGDTLVAHLRQPTADDPYVDESQCRSAVARARGVLGRPPADTPAPLLGRTLGEYQLLEELGHGGMGRVYKALHTKLDRVVAAKLLLRGRGSDPQAISRFEREMRAVGRLTHPNIVQAHDAREIEGTPVLIMEFVDGLDLAEIVRRTGALPVAAACELVRQTAAALQCAHEHGLVHRDIKPSNIMLTPAGEVKLLDLGLARFYAETTAGEEMTGSGQAMGTADYMAPEQAADSRSVDIRADLYSLGCTLYKLLAGRAPFAGPEYRRTLDKLNAHVQQPAPPVRQFALDVPDELEAIVARLLAKNPGDRFATPAELAVALEPFCGGADLPSLAARAMAISSPLPPGQEQGEASSPSPLPPGEGQGATAISSPLPPGEGQGEAAIFSPLPPGEGQGEGRRSARSLPAPRRRHPIAKAVATGLAFLALMAGAFAAGVLITIKKNGQTYRLEVPPDSRTRVSPEGNATVTIPGKAKAGSSAAVNPAVKPTATAVPPGRTLLYFYADWAGPCQAMTPIVDTLAGEGYAVQRVNIDNDKELAWKFNVTSLPCFVILERGVQVDGVAGCVTLAPLRAALQRPSNVPPSLWPANSPAVNPAAELNALQGPWEVVRVEKGKAAADSWSESPLAAPESINCLDFGPRDCGIIDLTGMGLGANGKFRYRIDPTATPKTIDFYHAPDREIELTGEPVALGLYDVQGDRLTICLAPCFSAVTKVDQRPKRLAVEPAGGEILLVLQRRAPSPDDRLFRGWWAIDRQVDDGKSLSAAVLGSRRYYFQDRWPENIWIHEVTAHDVKTLSRGSMVLDTTKEPRQITMKMVDPNHEPSQWPVLHGIYRFEGERLHLAYRRDGPAPEKFASPPGSGVTLLDLRKTAVPDAANMGSTTNLVFTGPPVPAANPAVNPAAELKALQGPWEVFRMEKGKAAGALWIYNGNQSGMAPESVSRLEFGPRDCDILDFQDVRLLHLRYRIDPAATPKTIDFFDLSDKDKDKERPGEPVALGIYEVQGDQLKICLAGCSPAVIKGDPRPKRLAVEPAGGDVLLALQRVSPSQDEQLFHGWWAVDTQVDDGKPLSAAAIGGQKYSFGDGSPFNIQLREQTDQGWAGLWTGSGVVDAAKEPRRITMKMVDYRPQPPKRLTFHGIYKFEGNRLHVAYRQNGPAPEKFASTPGSGVTLLVLRKSTEPDFRRPSRAASPALPVVAVSHPLVRQVSDYVIDVDSGLIEAAQTVKIQARVSGTLDKIHFHGGMTVKPGEVLLEIDPSTFKAEVAKQEAEVQLGRLRLKVLTVDSEQAKSLSPPARDRLAGKQAEAEAALLAAQKALDVAQLNLTHATISAPIAGKISRPLLDPGNLVEANHTCLATIISQDPVFVSFFVDQRTAIQLNRPGKSAAPGKGPADRDTAVSISCGLATDQGFPYRGKIDSVDPQVEPGGTVHCRAVVPNPEGILMPGMTARVRLAFRDPQPVLLVAESAVRHYNNTSHRHPSTGFVITVNDSNIVEFRTVKIGQQAYGMRVVQEGLRAEDWVVVSAGHDIPSISPGMQVQPQKTAWPNPPPDGQSPSPGGQPPAVKSRPEGEPKHSLGPPR